MIADLKADSERWELDVARRKQHGYPQGTYYYVEDLNRSPGPNRVSESYDTSSIHDNRQRIGPSYTTNQPYRDPYSSPPHPYGSSAPNPPYGSQPSGYPSVPAYGTAAPYVPGQTPPAVTTSEMQSYTHSSGGYPYNDGRSAPRFSGQGYEVDHEYSPGVTSGMPYPATTAAPDPRMMDPRYTAEPVYPEHMNQSSRAQPPRDRDQHRRAR